MSEILKAGYGESMITPSLGVDLTGYGIYLDRRAESVFDDLKTRVLFLGKGDTKVILISCDLLGFSIEFSDVVRRQIASEHGLPCRNILLACIHTHTGPASQQLRGMGKLNQSYLEKVAAAIADAARLAAADQEEAKLRCRIETVEPIGVNRRKGNFDEIDPKLKVAVFDRAGKKIYLVSYACHPVTLGPAKAISADWPGALVKAVEKSGNHAIFFQGFCGDIDPVTNINRWGAGTREDLCFYGELLCDRVFRAERYAQPVDAAFLNAVERRINVSLQIPEREGNDIKKPAWLERNEGKGNHLMQRYTQSWVEEANAKYEALKARPCLENVPLHRISVGVLEILGLPGEVFCQYGLSLSKKWPLLFTFGYADGNIGYLPTTDAYKLDSDYACYRAPMFYQVFPFARELEEVVLKECRDMLAYE